MEKNNPTPDLQTTGTHQENPFFHYKWYIILSIILIFTLAAALLLKNQVIYPVAPTNKESSPTKTVSNHPSNFFVSKLKKPLSEIVISDFPNSQQISGALLFQNNLYAVGEGSIFIYNPDGKVIQFSDPDKAYCQTNPVIIDENLYVGCFPVSVPYFYKNISNLPGYEVYKINLKTLSVEKTFSKKDGLLNGNNYELFADNEYLWVSTFEGVGRINTRTNKVDFYKEEVGFITDVTHPTYSTSNVIVDTNDVWVVSVANAYSSGGLARYNKKTGEWTKYGPAEIKDHELDRLDIEYVYRYAIKKTPGGIQIAFRDGSIGGYDRLVEKQFLYSTGKWTKISEQPFTGPFYEKFSKEIENSYSSDNLNVRKDEITHLTQVISKTPLKTYLTNGRRNLIITPLYGNKRYILTSASIDFIDNTLLSTLLIPLNEVFYSDSPTDNSLSFLVEPTSEKGIISRVMCGADSPCRTEVFLLDLKMAAILKKYENPFPFMSGLNNWKLALENNILTVSDNTQTIFTIDPLTYSLTLLAKPTASPSN